MTALGTRLTTLESTSQPMLTNGPQPDPAERMLTLLVQIERIQVS